MKKNKQRKRRKQKTNKQAPIKKKKLKQDVVIIYTSYIDLLIHEVTLIVMTDLSL